MVELKNIKSELRAVSTPQRALVSQRFFKTGQGEYGEGDVFIGVTMSEQRVVAKRHVGIELKGVQQLLDSKIHEERMVGLLILTYQFPRGNEKVQKEIYEFYLKNTTRINSWDLVDVTAPKIVGSYLVDKDRSILVKLAKSKLLWDRRIAILSTMTFIAIGEYESTFKIAKLLVNDKHDLIHKAVGWMLREVGNRCGQDVERVFLDKHYKAMPRTMLRYAIEKFSPEDRRSYLNS